MLADIKEGKVERFSWSGCIVFFYQIVVDVSSGKISQCGTIVG
jgi:hypothetical protein